MMVTIPPEENGDYRFLRSHRISLGVLLALGVQAVTFTVWLTNMRADVTQLQRDVVNLAHEIRQARADIKGDHDPLAKRIEAMDQNGTRALETLRNRQNDVIAINAAQDARIRELEGKFSELQRQAVENKFWVDQAVAIIRQYAHQPAPSLPRGAPP